MVSNLSTRLPIIHLIYASGLRDSSKIEKSKYISSQLRFSTYNIKFKIRYQGNLNGVGKNNIKPEFSDNVTKS